VSDVIAQTRKNLFVKAPGDIDEVREERKPLVSFSPKVRKEATQLKQFLYKNLYRHPRVFRNTRQADEVIKELFAAFYRKPSLMPAEHAAQAAKSGQKAVVVADYIAGMTDRYALDQRARL
jgi:dGTPase